MLSNDTVCLGLLKFLLNLFSCWFYYKNNFQSFTHYECNWNFNNVTLSVSGSNTKDWGLLIHLDSLTIRSCWLRSQTLGAGEGWASCQLAEGSRDGCPPGLLPACLPAPHTPPSRAASTAQQTHDEGTHQRTGQAHQSSSHSQILAAGFCGHF